jgi:tetratricopeptide (TPR) repeat protein
MAQSDLRMGILELVRLTRAAEQELVADLSAEERAATGTPEQWSAKDMIAHVTAWRLRQAERLRAALEGVEPPPLGTDDEENAEIFATYSERSWREVEDDAERSVAELADLLPAFSDADLTDGQRYAWTEGRPLLLTVVGNGAAHPATHLEWYYRARDQPERAIHAQAMLVEVARGARLPDQVLANAIYNLACAYALNGDAAAAVTNVSEALRIHPNLALLARDDPDFASIRALPAFQAVAGS